MPELLTCPDVVLTDAEIRAGLYFIFRGWGIPEGRAEVVARRARLAGVADRVNARSAREGCRVAATEE